MSDTWKLVPVEPTEQMIEAGRHVKRMRLLDSVKAVREGRDPEELMGKTAGAEYRAMLEAAPAPPVPSSVQEIMQLIYPYMRACLEANEAEIVRSRHPRVTAAFTTLESALTALVDERDRLKFELDGVNATRPAPSMTTMQAIYAKAWMRAADWANRHDLHSDVGSPAYLKDMASELAEFADVAMDGVRAMRGPLTVEQILESPCGINDGTQSWLIGFARAIEKAHGIEPEQGDGGGV